MTTDLDQLKAEVLRQKIIFEAELRRQRETYEVRLGNAEQQLQDRETDCRNLQSVITILGKKVDALQDHVMQLSSASKSAAPSVLSGSQTPRRVPSPSRSDVNPSPYRRQASPSHISGGSASLNIPLRKDGVPSLTLLSGRAPSLNSAAAHSTSRASSPGRVSNVSSSAVRPKVVNRVTTPRTGRQHE